MYKINNTDISNGVIKKEIVDVMKSLKIKNLNCENMFYLKQIPKIRTLEYLVLSGCSVKQLPNMPNLKILICNNSGIEKLPLMPNLEYLDCHHNRKLKELPIKMPKLKYLDCSGSRVSIIHNYKDLEYLDCSLCNKIKTIPYLPKLTELKCNNSFMNKRKINNIEDYDNWLNKVKNIVLILGSNKTSKRSNRKKNINILNNDVLRKLCEEYL